MTGNTDRVRIADHLGIDMSSTESDVMKHLSFEEKLRIQFTKALRRSACDNAVLDPSSSDYLADHLADGETVVVRVDGRDGTKYWFTPHSVFREHGTNFDEILRYSQISSVGWIPR